MPRGLQLKSDRTAVPALRLAILFIYPLLWSYTPAQAAMLSGGDPADNTGEPGGSDSDPHQAVEAEKEDDAVVAEGATTMSYFSKMATTSSSNLTRLVLVTDRQYQARGRDYQSEDVELAGLLLPFFAGGVVLLDVQELPAFVLENVMKKSANSPGAGGAPERVVLLMRNTGPTENHRPVLDFLLPRLDQHAQLREVLYNDLLGQQCDLVGKQYLVDLAQNKGFSGVLPTSLLSDLATSGLSDLTSKEFCLKPLRGADSNGLELNLSFEQLQARADALNSPAQLASKAGGAAAAAGEGEGARSFLVQPMVAFEYEVSFFFVDDTFVYAMYTPDPENRWDVREYASAANGAGLSAPDLAFAAQFVDRSWNGCRRGVQRVDACREKGSGKLFLMEVEDYNPWLSLDKLSPETKKNFVQTLAESLRRFASGGTGACSGGGWGEGVRGGAAETGAV